MSTSSLNETHEKEWKYCTDKLDGFLEDSQDLPSQCRLIPLTENDAWEACLKKGALTQSNPLPMSEEGKQKRQTDLGKD